ncbi:cation-transporting ATPase E [Microbacteriaceae bacterium SG_E_30_P1]|uniref:Cation-transporting ATPase E n=1 Tax=Antiquaquibacter oligotrophicus TaxID=2880260 RepID=A0ABT6KMX6_9MICO|nr:HAD-IC family P-type ATPase [Antiquaquibacter oligotrophicus]MDH6180788.1 cation-transporting ATPase E [Antiquaquibacter oligotrophicus]UDF13493.1 HAD-IC family P-type ATPase [Antiquaquibacter oligotrophicus]
MLTAPEGAIAERGLSAAEVAARRADGRTNAFSPPSSRSLGAILRANVLTLFNAIIAGCFIVLLAIGHWQDALFGLSALANAVIGTVQEYRAKLALDRLALLNAPLARVRRDDVEQQVAVAEVVLDDLLELRPGEQVPADAAVVSSARLQVDESMLTGESDPVDKDPGDRLLSGSVVVAGEGAARVDRVGADSFANQLASQAKRFSLVASELRSSINRVLTWLTWAIGPLTLLVLNAQMVAEGGWAEAIESGDWRDAAVDTIAAVVAMIPLGLVLMTSIAFAVGAVKLSRRKVLVQELAAVEGLARVDIICLDKTGTLTAGDIVFDEAHALGDHSNEDWHAVLAWNGAEPDANATARCLAPEFPITEPLVAAERIPFSSARKWSAVSFSTGPTGTWVLGGPEMVFGDGGEYGPLLKRAAELAGSGRRTLVLARADAQLTAEDADAERRPEQLEPVALLTFRESIRPDARETLEYFADQGVDVRIISGDNPHTVAAIAREVGLENASGFDARDLPEDERELREVLERNQVFGRVTPEQKRAIVLALKAAGHTVAMTGDGVNDALAIKDADIGIAMESGSAATKAVARLILLDGRFSHLPGVVKEGRQVIANVERVSMLFLSKTSYAVALALVFGALMIEFPFLPRQLSVTDGLTIGIPAFFLALLPNARRYEPGFLRRSLSFAIPSGLVIAAMITAIALIAGAQGVSVAEERTGATIAIALAGLAVLVSRSLPFSLIKAAIVAAMILGLILVVTVPIASSFLILVPLPPPYLTAVLGCTAVAVVGIALVHVAHSRWVAVQR